MAEKKGMVQAHLKKGNIVFWNKDHTKWIAIPTYHVSCQSHKYDHNKNMIGIIFYQRDDKKEIFYVEHLKCRPAYILLAYSSEIAKIRRNNETMHAATFRYFVGKELHKYNIIGAGFSIQEGQIVCKSGTFNAPSNNYGLFHDDNREMHNVEKYVLEKVIENWKNGQQNTRIADVVKNTNPELLKKIIGKQS